ncbi:MAG: hypothetical protein ACE5OR_00915, partial [bacterium]
MAALESAATVLPPDYRRHVSHREVGCSVRHPLLGWELYSHPQSGQPLSSLRYLGRLPQQHHTPGGGEITSREP